MSLMRSSFFKLPSYRKFNYKPIYFDPQAEELKIKRELRLERGSFYKGKSTLVGAFTDKEYAFRSRSRGGSQFGRTLLLTLMMFFIFAYFMGKLPTVVAFGLVAICLVFFVRSVNKVS